MTHTHYQPPQSISASGLVFGGVAAVAGALVLAPIYSLAIAYIPFVYLNAILTAVAGGLIGLMTVAALRAGKFQNTPMSFAIALGALFFAYWIHWIAWFGVLGFRADADISMLALLWPPNLFEIVGIVYDSGTWGIRGTDAVSGGALGFVWVVEALIFFGVGMLGAASLAGSGTFCERCDDWCERVLDHAMELDETGELVAAINERQDFSGVPTPPVGPEPAMWHKIEIDQCPTCGETATLTLFTFTRTFDSKGNAEDKSELEVDRVYIGAADVARIVNPGAGAPPAGDDPAPAVAAG